MSYNAEYDWDLVLLPEWKRLRIAAIGRPGFCAMRLAQRLLDPVPAGNCKPCVSITVCRNAAHTWRWVTSKTVADLMANVLRPIAEQRGLDTWEKLTAIASEEWYPSRIAFGKHKGRCVWDAREDVTLRAWLEWLSTSSNARSAGMGRWYLRNLERDGQTESGFAWSTADAQHADAQGSAAASASGSSTTFRDGSGRISCTASSSSSGSTTYRDASGRITGTSSISGGSITYRDACGHITGTATVRK